jgi:hypothetical protein
MKDAFVYKWTNNNNGMWYIGYHKGKVDDGYICSSSYMLNDYNLSPESFSRIIIDEGNAKEMFELETKLLTELDAKNDNLSYNKSNNYFPYIGNDKDVNDKRSKTLKKMRQSEEYKAKASIAAKKRWENPEYRQKQIQKGLERWQRDEFVEKIKNINSNPDEMKRRSEAQSKLLIERWKNSEYREMMEEKLQSYNEKKKN